MGKDTYVGWDALGQPFGYGDLVVSSSENAPYGKPGRKFITGIVSRITAKSYVNLLDEDGELHKDSRGKTITYAAHQTILLAHASEVDKYRKHLIQWEQDNREGL